MSEEKQTKEQVEPTQTAGEGTIQEQASPEVEKPAAAEAKPENKQPEQPAAGEAEKKEETKKKRASKKAKSAKPETSKAGGAEDEDSKAGRIIDQIVDLTAELKMKYMPGLRKALEEKFEVSAAAAPVAMMAPGAAEPEQEEKTSFDVWLTEIGEHKIQVIKAVRSITNLGLRDAKGVVDSAPRAVKEEVTQDEADQIKAALEEAGATVEIR